MEHIREIKNKLTWHSIDGKFEAELTNGQITALSFCEPGKGADNCGKCLTSTNYKYLVQVRDSLNELLLFIDEENKRQGYSYATDKDLKIVNDENTAAA